jgi:hypothetical protein
MNEFEFLKRLLENEIDILLKPDKIDRDEERLKTFRIFHEMIRKVAWCKTRNVPFEEYLK